MLTPEQQSRLFAARAATEEGEDEERLERLRQREEDVETLRRISELLTVTGFASGNDLSRAQLLDLLALIRALAPNPNLDARLLARPGEPDAFNRDLRDLLAGPTSVPLRLRHFLTRRHAGDQTALQLLCAAYPTAWPLVTQAGLRTLELSTEQWQTALLVARARFDLPALSTTLPTGTAEALPDTDPVLRLLARIVIYTEILTLLDEPDYVAVHRLLTSGRSGLAAHRSRLARYAPPTPAPAQSASARHAPSESATGPSPLRIREPGRSEYGQPAVPSESENSEPAISKSTIEEPAIMERPRPIELGDTRTADLLHTLETELAARGFTYPPLMLRDYYLCLQTKPYVWLLGINGIGKTRLTSLFAELLTGNTAEQYRLIPVRPDWADSTPLLGYVNLLAGGGAGRYVSTPFLEFLLRAARPENANRAFFLCLDEMNLARVEHYFAEFLSAMEAPDRALLLPNGQTLRLPDNLFVTGTLNTDEATFSLSSKVLDRANTLSLHTVALKWQDHESEPADAESAPLAFALRQGLFLQRRVTNPRQARQTLHGIAAVMQTADLAEWVVDRLVEINFLLAAHDIQIAYRVRDEVLCYCANSFDSDGGGLLTPQTPLDAQANLAVALDFQLMQKVLPRLNGARDQIEPPLRHLLRWAETSRFPRTAQKLTRLLARLQRDGFISYE